MIREKVKSFAKEKRELLPGRHKIIILDEVDSMTEAAQQVSCLALSLSSLLNSSSLLPRLRSFLFLPCVLAA